MTIGELISQVRGEIKLANADARFTDKAIWSVINKHAKWLIKRESSKLKVMRSDTIFQTLKCVQVIQAPTIDDCCGIKTHCYVYRTAEKIPEIYEDDDGVLIRTAFSIDGSTEITPITIQEYMRKIQNPTTIKYDKSRYFYYNNGYLYFPKQKLKEVMIKAYFMEDIKKYIKCNKDEGYECVAKQDETFRFPQYLLGELMNFVLKELSVPVSIPDDTDINKNDNRKN